MLHVVYTFFAIDMAIHELNPNLICRHVVPLEFHREVSVIQQIFDRDTRHLHPNFTKMKVQNR